MDELSERDRPAVEAGMELAGWQLPRPAKLIYQVPRDGADVWALLVVLVVAWVGAGLVIFNLVTTMSNSWAILASTVVIGAVLVGILRLYRRVRPDPGRQEQTISAQRAQFTSTGVAVGELARLWRGPNYRLRSVSVDGGLLTVDFGARGTVEIPVPAALEGDVREMVQVLGARTRKLESERVPESPKPTSDGG